MLIQDFSRRSTIAVVTTQIVCHFYLFFISQPLGYHKMRELIQSAWLENPSTGSGQNGGICMHSLRGTVSTALMEARRADSAISMRTWHKEMNILKSYQNFRGNVGRTQHRFIFSSANAPTVESISRLKRVGYIKSRTTLLHMKR